MGYRLSAGDRGQRGKVAEADWEPIADSRNVCVYDGERGILVPPWSWRDAQSGGSVAGSSSDMADESCAGGHRPSSVAPQGFTSGCEGGQRCTSREATKVDDERSAVEREAKKKGANQITGDRGRLQGVSGGPVTLPACSLSHLTTPHFLCVCRRVVCV